MRINQIRNREVDVTLTSDELVAINNMLYERSEKEPLKSTMHSFAAEVITAMNLCQYGHLDSFAVTQIFKHQMKAGKVSKARLEKIINLLEEIKQ